MNRIKEILKDKGISQTWLAKKLYKSHNIIYDYARNVRQQSIEDLYRNEVHEHLNKKIIL
jgi:ribosome-binding protein aMBF1 (putative translation factor)